MHSFNKKIIKSVDAKNSVSDYSAKKIVTELPKRVDSSNSFKAEFHGDSGSFRMDEILQERTGIGEKRRQEIMEQVEEGVIDKLESVEEEAYNKAYQLGMEEGKQQGLKEAENIVQESITSLDQLMFELQELRSRLVIENESQLVQLSYFLAKKIAMKSIEEDPEYIINCVSTLIDSMQSDTEITLKISETDYDFLEKFRDRDIKTKEMLSNVKLYKEEALSRGECIFESNHGIVNATMEERINKLWATLSENLPKESLGSETSVNEVENLDKDNKEGNDE